ncbi:MAG: hypothetical protein A2934_03505 [Candidatus Sungbacteria bacterium RIFCSPLOWO2_01_FULL_47_10]|uniref:Uncharacterized protein n=1 Tax=Candidatus Sungbacteria bacterium RIFCSPLOWO2_01_FULL_47_10 TaxID=1802276 RepID=A0A1G2L3Z4_9BACT|nr:MAG: hypothetical protein A2934_03505 [Candidatus Sungbacteria bacterium RIFCSPLOWO2_01_FULL_47_10]
MKEGNLAVYASERQTTTKNRMTPARLNRIFRPFCNEYQRRSQRIVFCIVDKKFVICLRAW